MTDYANDHGIAESYVKLTYILITAEGAIDSKYFTLYFFHIGNFTLLYIFNYLPNYYEF